MTTDAQMPELLPCPFCGSGPAVSIQNASFSGVEPLYWHGLHFVNCGTCGVEGAKDKDRAAAIAAWNRRADLYASGQVRALEWRSAGYDGQTLEASALGLKVFYRVHGKPGRWTLTSPGASEYVHTPGYETRAYAQAAAQVDYERRILAALTPAPQPSMSVAEAALLDLQYLANDLSWDRRTRDISDRILAALRALKGGDA